LLLLSVYGCVSLPEAVPVSGRKARCRIVQSGIAH
jgi:hypothetical protein